ncbi:MAG: DUF3298 domain-containing protein [Clostridia bacterium]|nr:DUF3298 domain-containing protein [Clostridia bacterium]
MDKITKMKQEYEEIKAPQSMYASAEAIFGKRRSNSLIIRRVLSTAAMFVLCFVLTVNFIPDTAKALMEVPVLDSIVRAVTLGRFEVKNDSVDVDIQKVQIEGLLDEASQNELNKLLADKADHLIAAIENDIKEMGEDAHLGVKSSFIVKADTDDLLAIDVYIENIEGSAAVSHEFYNIDKKSGKLISFDSLVEKDGIQAIDEFIRAEMERRNAEEEGTFEIGENGFTTIGDAPKFYVNESGNIVICFDEYEVAAGSEGSPEFEIVK